LNSPGAIKNHPGVNLPFKADLNFGMIAFKDEINLNGTLQKQATA
jgi:hypothetical protein